MTRKCKNCSYFKEPKRQTIPASGPICTRPCNETAWPDNPGCGQWKWKKRRLAGANPLGGGK